MYQAVGKLKGNPSTIGKLIDPAGSAPYWLLDGRIGHINLFFCGPTAIFERKLFSQGIRIFPRFCLAA